jgi:hypothetical protein
VGLQALTPLGRSTRQVLEEADNLAQRPGREGTANYGMLSFIQREDLLRLRQSQPALDRQTEEAVELAGRQGRQSASELGRRRCAGKCLHER